MNHKLSPTSFKPQAVVAALQRNRVALIGAVLIGLFGYTAYVINAALNVTPTAAAESTSIRFDKSAITTVENLEVVPVSVGSTPGGKTDPFTK